MNWYVKLCELVFWYADAGSAHMNRYDLVVDVSRRVVQLASSQSMVF